MRASRRRTALRASATNEMFQNVIEYVRAFPAVFELFKILRAAEQKYETKLNATVGAIYQPVLFPKAFSPLSLSLSLSLSLYLSKRSQ